MPAQLFTDEWKTLKQDPVKEWRPRYAELGTIEKWIPLLFMVLNLALAAYVSAA